MKRIKVNLAVSVLGLLLVLGTCLAGYVAIELLAYNQHDTQELLDNVQKLNKEEMTELANKTLIVCSDNLPEHSAMNVESFNNIHVLTYENTMVAKYDYSRLSNNDAVSACEFDSVLTTSTVEDELSEENTEIAPTDVTEDNTNTSYADMNILQNIHSTDVDLSETVIAILDSGFDGVTGYNAFDGSNNVDDMNGHGTLMLSTLSENLRGYSNGYSVVPIKVANDIGIGSLTALLNGLEWLISSDCGVDIVNISMSTVNTTKSKILEAYIDKLVDHNVQVVVSAGNNSDNVMNYAPAKFDSPITVGSCDSDGNITDFSNYGKSVDCLVESNSTSEAAITVTSLYAKALLTDEKFEDVLSESGKVYSYSNDIETDDSEIIDYNNTDVLDYNTCGCSGGTPTNTGDTTFTGTGLLSGTYKGTTYITIYTEISNPARVHEHLTSHPERTSDGSDYYISYDYEYHPDNLYLGTNNFTRCTDSTTKSFTKAIDSSYIHTDTLEIPDVLVRSDPRRVDFSGNWWAWHGAYYYGNWKYHPTKWSDLDEQNSGYNYKTDLIETLKHYTKLNDGSWTECTLTEQFYVSQYASGDTVYYADYSEYLEEYSPVAEYTFPYYDLDLDANEGTVSTDQYTMGYKRTSNRSINTATRDRYTFEGWFTSPTGGTQIFDSNGNATNDGTYWKSDNTWGKYQDVTLYAQWTLSEFDMTLNHHKYNPETGEYDFWKTTTDTAIAGDIYIPQWAETPTGYFNEKRDYEDGWEVTGPMTFNLYYCPIQYEVDYVNGAPAQGTTSGTVQDQNCYYTLYYNYQPYGYTNTYYYQTGWEVLDNHEDENDLFSNLTTTQGATITATAEWTPKPYTIIYHKGHETATGDDVTQSVTTAETFTMNDGSTFSKDGYKILGWSRTEGATAPDYALSEVRQAFTGALSTTKDDVVHLYAVWKAREYTVRYKANGGSGADIVETWTYEQPHTLYNNYTNKHFTKFGYFVNRYVFNNTTNIIPDILKQPLYSGGEYDVNYTVQTTNQAIGDLIVPTQDGMEVVLNCNWSPIAYKVQYNNDSATKQMATNGNFRGYKVSTAIYTTSVYIFGNKYDLDWYNFTRENKYGKSLFLGYGLIDEDASLEPKWSVVGRVPASTASKPSQLTATDFVGQTTKEDTEYNDYFGYLNGGSVQTFNIYSVWDDCPGIEPVDIYDSMIGGDSTIQRAKMPNSSVKSGMQIEYDILYHPDNVNSIWDREGNVKSAGNLGKDNYYISHLMLSHMQTQENITTYEIKYTIEDDNGNKYTVSRKLYSGVLADIMIGN